MELWETGAIINNVTATTVGTEALPAAGGADTYLSSKVSTNFSDGNFIGVFKGQNNTYGFSVGKDVSGEEGESTFNNVVNNGGKGFLFQSQNGGFGVMGVSRTSNLLESESTDLVPITSNLPVVQNSDYPSMINFNSKMSGNQAMIVGNNPLLLDEKGSKASPSEIAQSWQGDFPYVGVDKYRDITLKKGKVIYVGDPYPTGDATTKSAVDRINSDSRKLFEGLK